MSRAEKTIARYVAWIDRRALAIIAAHLLLLAGAVVLILTRLPLYADFSYLLPQEAQSVRDMRRLESRVAGGDVVLVVVQAPTPDVRAAAVADFAAAARQLPPAFVESVEDDDAELRDFLRPRKHLFVPYDDLVKARDALATHVREAKLKANPLFIDIDDEPDPAVSAKEQQQLDELRAKRKEAESRLDKNGNVSADGRTALVIVRAPFRSTAAGQGEQLLRRLDTLRSQVTAKHGGVEIGFTGGIVTAVAEHEAIFNGMVVSSLITTLLVSLVLVLYFRSATLLVLLVSTLGIATALSFGAAALTVGHLNAATAFLGAIIAGNGINYGILLIARYLDERRTHDMHPALVRAIEATLRPTAVASLGAAIAYGSLAATSFKGFADFAVIGAMGMLLCWLATYLLFPALLLRFGKRVRTDRKDPALARMLVRWLGFKHSARVVIAAVVIAAFSTVITIRYISADPFEYDIKNLRSEGESAVTSRKWLAISDQNFGRGISGRTYIAADRPEQVPMIVEALRAHDGNVPVEQRTLGKISSVLDAVPERQPEKLAVLAEIRTILDENMEGLDDAERAELLELRPPDDLKAFTAEDLPPRTRASLTEKNGRIGLMVAVRPAEQLDEWDGRDLIRFANAVRRVELPDKEVVTTSGSSVIFADIVDSIERDGPLVTGIAAGGLILMVLILVGPNRRGIAVLAATFGGSLLMVAVCAMLGLRVNFLDFVALPITLGLGIDYAINVGHRNVDDDPIADPLVTLRTSGAAVLVCSVTTIIGYGSLLGSQNLAIRGFGTASLIGEIACVFSALVLVPAILGLGYKRLPSADH